MDADQLAQLEQTATSTLAHSQGEIPSLGQLQRLLSQLSQRKTLLDSLRIPTQQPPPPKPQKLKLIHSQPTTIKIRRPSCDPKTPLAPAKNKRKRTLPPGSEQEPASRESAETPQTERASERASADARPQLRPRCSPSPARAARRPRRPRPRPGRPTSCPRARLAAPAASPPPHLPPIPPAQPTPSQPPTPAALLASSFFADPPPAKPKPRRRPPAPERLRFGRPGSHPPLPAHPHLATPKSVPAHPLPLPPLPCPPTSSSSTGGKPPPDRPDPFAVPADPLYTLPLPGPIVVPAGCPRTQGDVHADFSRTRPPATQTPTHVFQGWVSDQYLRPFGEDDLAFLGSELASINGCPSVRVHRPPSGDQAPDDDTFRVPPPGRHYADVWRDEDRGLPPRPVAPGPAPSPLLRASVNALSPDALASEAVRLGPLAARLVSAILPCAPLLLHPAPIGPRPSRPPPRWTTSTSTVDWRTSCVSWASSRTPSPVHPQPPETAAEDDEIACVLRRAQAVLARQAALNRRRKQTLAGAVRRRMAVQEFDGVRAGLDRRVFQLFLRRQTLLGSSGPTKAGPSRGAPPRGSPARKRRPDEPQPADEDAQSKMASLDRAAAATLHKRRRLVERVGPVLLAPPLPGPLPGPDPAPGPSVSAIHRLPTRSVYAHLAGQGLGVDEVPLDVDRRFIV
ncbi:hypothetical protein PTTG_28356 [Puccinia triticina 1-1 BBBD Race 1]|uniref:Uncharacterized protein n=1 Tax=Puccinia triticina (isolate 1-1 / race 1 (BBBD)) TaxID=630390 RepID=A0A180GCH5_PUCT1|nr:hypothetical protein PTTG_28356 [Puccinia triticina 1-1 BBBD Race 1]